MSRVLGCMLLIAPLTWVASAVAGEPAYREIQVSFAYAAVTPSGEWKDVMGSGQGFAADLGMAVSSKVSVGLHFGLSVLNAKVDQIGPFEAAISGNDWMRYIGGWYSEFRFLDTTVSPFAAVGLGVHGVHVSYVDVVDSADGQGDFGIGYSLSAGLQYRGNSRLGGVFRVDLENSPSMGDGWFSQAQLGLRLFL